MSINKYNVMKIKNSVVFSLCQQSSFLALIYNLIYVFKKNKIWDIVLDEYHHHFWYK